MVSEEVEECLVFFHPPLSQLAQDAGSSMSYMRIRGVSARPFIIALLFLSLAGLLEQAEAPGGFQFSVRSSRLQHICVFSHQCEIVQYDGRLMLKQD